MHSCIIALRAFFRARAGNTPASMNMDALTLCQTTPAPFAPLSKPKSARYLPQNQIFASPTRDVSLLAQIRFFINRKPRVTICLTLKWSRGAIYFFVCDVRASLPYRKWNVCVAEVVHLDACLLFTWWMALWTGLCFWWYHVTYWAAKWVRARCLRYAATRLTSRRRRYEGVAQAWCKRMEQSQANKSGLEVPGFVVI